MKTYKEQQTYPFWVIVSMAIILGMSPFILSDVFESEPNSFYKIMLLSGLVALLTALFFLSVRIKTAANREQIKLSFFPFTWSQKTFEWSSLKKAQVRESKSFREFGGLGYRIGKKKKAFTLYGRWGLDLTFDDDSHVFIGTQQHIKLQDFINSQVYPYFPNLKPEAK